jgi:amino acid transporter
VFSFAGVESLAMAAAETQNPRRNIPKACKKVFARVLIFYVLAGGYACNPSGVSANIVF